MHFYKLLYKAFLQYTVGEVHWNGSFCFPYGREIYQFCSFTYYDFGVIFKNIGITPGHKGFLLYYMLDYLDWFSNIELAFHSWKKVHYSTQFTNNFAESFRACVQEEYLSGISLSLSLSLSLKWCNTDLNKWIRKY